MKKGKKKVIKNEDKKKNMKIKKQLTKIILVWIIILYLYLDEFTDDMGNEIFIQTEDPIKKMKKK